MNGSRALAILIWSACILIAAVVVVRARYITDLSAFLPDKPTPMDLLRASS
jgi:predicted exporter